MNNSFSLPASNYGLSKYLQVFHAAGLAAKEHEVRQGEEGGGPQHAPCRAVQQQHSSLVPP